MYVFLAGGGNVGAVNYNILGLCPVVSVLLNRVPGYRQSPAFRQAHVKVGAGGVQRVFNGVVVEHSDAHLVKAGFSLLALQRIENGRVGVEGAGLALKVLRINDALV